MKVYEYEGKNPRRSYACEFLCGGKQYIIINDKLKNDGKEVLEKEGIKFGREVTLTELEGALLYAERDLQMITLDLNAAKRFLGYNQFERLKIIDEGTLEILATLSTQSLQNKKPN